MTVGLALFRLFAILAIIAMGAVTAAQAMHGPTPSSVVSAKAGSLVAIASIGSHQESAGGDIDDRNCPPSDAQACCHSFSSGCFSPAISVERVPAMTASAANTIHLRPMDTAADGTDPEATKKPPKTLV